MNGSRWRSLVSGLAALVVGFIAGAIGHVGGIVAILLAAGTFALVRSIQGSPLLGGLGDVLKGTLGTREAGVDLQTKLQAAGSVKQAIERLATGNIAVDAPTTMKVDERKKVDVTIGLGTREEFLASITSADKNLVVEQTKVADWMQVTLSSDPDAFSIETLGQADRTLGNRQTWTFYVRAKSPGRQTLHVVVAVLIQLPGQPMLEPHYAPVKDIVIEVRVSCFSTAKKYMIAILGVAGAFLGWVFALDPVKDMAIDLFNRLIGVHIGFEIPTKH